MCLLQFLEKKYLGSRNKFFCQKISFNLSHIGMNTLLLYDSCRESNQMRKQLYNIGKVHTKQL